MNSGYQALFSPITERLGTRLPKVMKSHGALCLWSSAIFNKKFNVTDSKNQFRTSFESCFHADHNGTIPNLISHLHTKMYLVQCSLPCLFPIPISVHCSIFGGNSTSFTLQNRSAVVACRNRFQKFNVPILAQNHISVCLASNAVERYMYRTLHCCTLFFRELRSHTCTRRDTLA